MFETEASSQLTMSPGGETPGGAFHRGNLRLSSKLRPPGIGRFDDVPKSATALFEVRSEVATTQVRMLKVRFTQRSET